MFFCEEKNVPQAHCNWFDFLTWVVNAFKKIRSIMKENVTICLKLVYRAKCLKNA